MKTAYYAIVRFVADPMRNEPLNIGLISWFDEHHRLRLHSRAIERVLTYNPSLDPHAIDYVSDLLGSQIGAIVNQELSANDVYPIMLSAPLRIWLDEASVDIISSWENELIALENELIKPRTRRSTPRESSAKRELRKGYKPLIDAHRMYPDFPIDDTKTGKPRRADFYLNSGADTAIELLQIRPRVSMDTITRDLDAMRFQSEDLLYSSRIKQVVAHVFHPGSQQDYEVAENIRLILDADGIVVTESVEENLKLVHGIAAQAQAAD